MPPKKTQEIKKKQVEDKTFGLKNKNKSSKVRSYVEQVKQQAEQSGNPKDKENAEKKKNEIAMKKKAEEAKKAELAELFKPAIATQKVPFGVDPKTILCAHFKAGSCQKGSKCKFSHDLNVERKSEKINLYADARDNSQNNDTMEDWDQEKLDDAIAKKHNLDKNRSTEIVCKFFLEAIETRKYGWFWECPANGASCKYRHALPPGYVLKKKETEEERRAREQNEKENEITIEDFLETERHNLGSNLTPVTAESFMKWKKERKEKEAQELASQFKKRQEEFKKLRAGMKSGMTFSGKELFDFNPEMARDDDDDDGAMDEYQREKEDQEEVGAVKAKVWEDMKVSLELFTVDDLAGLEDEEEEED